MYDTLAQYHRDELAKKQLLQKIVSGLIDGTGTSQIVPTVSPTVATVTRTAITSPSTGSTAANNLSITFATSSDFIGTIGGISISNLAVETLSYMPGYVYPAIDYTVTAGTLWIIQTS